MGATTRTRLLGAAMSTVGTLILIRPGTAARAVTAPGRPSPRAAVVRALGARLLLQGAVTLVRPRAGALRGGAVVDLTHAASMVILAAADQRYRRPAVASAAVATSSALLAHRLRRALR